MKINNSGRWATVALCGAIISLFVSMGVHAEGATTGQDQTTNSGTCKGLEPSVIGVMSEANWSSLFPIKVFGIEIYKQDGATDPWEMTDAPFCICPGRLWGYPTLGIMLTMFTPRYVAEVEREPSCMSTIGQAVGSWSEGSRSAKTTNANNENKRQVHWIEFPAFMAIEEIQNSECVHSSNYVDVGYMTEYDYTWQDDLWGAFFGFEAALFSSVPAQMACAADAISSQFGQPLDALYWCWGHRNIFPLTGNNNIQTSNEQANMTLLGRFLFRQTRIMFLKKTIGDDAICSPQTSMIMSKQQYRLDPVHPIAAGTGTPVVPGKDDLLWGTIANYPTHESAIFTIWMALQCCIHI